MRGIRLYLGHSKFWRRTLAGYLIEAFNMQFLRTQYQNHDNEHGGRQRDIGAQEQWDHGSASGGNANREHHQKGTGGSKAVYREINELDRSVEGGERRSQE